MILQNGVVALSAEKRVLLTNPLGDTYLKQLAGIGVNEVLTQLAGQPFDQFLEVPPNGQGYHKLVLTKNPPPHQTFEIFVQPVEIGPHAGGWVVVLQDATQAQQMQERIQQQDRLAAIGQLAAGIAHDFNNILTSIIGFAELASINPQTQEITRRDLRRIINQGKRAADLVRQILDFSRQSVTEKFSLDLLPFLKELVKLLERTIPEDIRISLEVEPGDYMIKGNPAQLKQAITNLALNARDAMPSGGTLRFRLSDMVLEAHRPPPCPQMAPGRWLLLSIIDTGVGIPPEQMSHLFDPFFTTKEVGAGTGLGLAQTYGLVKQHDGEIDVQSQVGVGTTFTIYLPAVAAVPKSLPVDEAKMPQGNSEVILLVEDDSLVLDVSKTTLEYLGYSVLTAVNGRLALQMYEQFQAKISLVLTDLTMPEMDGETLVKALHDRNPSIKIILLTGYAFDGRGNMQAHGVVDWLQKPLGIDQLARTVNKAIKG